MKVYMYTLLFILNIVISSEGSRSSHHDKRYDPDSQYRYGHSSYGYITGAAIGCIMAIIIIIFIVVKCCKGKVSYEYRRHSVSPRQACDRLNTGPSMQPLSTPVCPPPYEASPPKYLKEPPAYSYEPPTPGGTVLFITPSSSYMSTLPPPPPYSSTAPT